MTLPAAVAVAALPVVSWFRTGKSAATAMLGTPVTVVFFRMPVSSPARETRLSLPTTVAAWVPVTSPERLPLKLTAVVAAGTVPVSCEPSPTNRPALSILASTVALLSCHSCRLAD